MKYAVLPCNGLDKSAGPMAREVAMALAGRDGGELICPVLLANSPDRYAKALDQGPLVVIDGCATQCATKLANRLGLKVGRKVRISEEVKRTGATIGKSLALGPEELRFAGAIATALLEKDTPAGAEATAGFAPPREYIEVAHDKFLFKIPKDGFLFNENNIWVQLSGNRARIGISDFAQQQMTDITLFVPPAIGAEVEQFAEAGYVESAKATLELVSPVSGRVVAVNAAMLTTPESINQDPYGEGWGVELELRDFSADRELLIDGPAYAEVVKRKAGEYS